MGKTLAQNVYVDGEWYGPAYGNEDITEATAKAIENPAAFESPRTGRLAGEGSDDEVEVDERRGHLEAMTVAELHEEADRLGVSVPKTAKKDAVVKAILAVPDE